jgi:hypothetical protein
MKKRAFPILALILILSTLAFVSAQTFADATESVVIDISQSIRDGLDTILINPSTLSSVLLGILLFIIIYSIVLKMKLFEGYGRILALVVALIFTLLTFIYMPDNFVEAIVLQYGAVGATILTLIPFMILLYFSFSVAEDLFVAKLTWIFYAMYYFGLFIYKIASSPYQGTFIRTVLTPGNIPYLLAILAGIFMVIMIRRLRIWRIDQEIKDAEEKGLTKTKKFKLLHKLKEKDLEAYTS